MYLLDIPGASNLTALLMTAIVIRRVWKITGWVKRQPPPKFCTACRNRLIWKKVFIHIYYFENCTSQNSTKKSIIMVVLHSMCAVIGDKAAHGGSRPKLHLGWQILWVGRVCHQCNETEVFNM
jgi:hypothetical protein